MKCSRRWPSPTWLSLSLWVCVLVGFLEATAEIFLPLQRKVPQRTAFKTPPQPWLVWLSGLSTSL